MPARILVLGGQRSGKSRYAEEIVAASGGVPVYVATGAGSDGEMRDRIAAHRARRGAEWRTVEAPLDLAAALARETGEGFHVLVDCLTFWVANLLAAGRSLESEADNLLAALSAVSGPVVLVSGEVGLGIIPDNAVSRRFADALGTVNQRVAAAVDRVVLVTAGLPLVLKAEQPNSEVSI